MNVDELADRLSMGVRRRRLERGGFTDREIEKPPTAFSDLPADDQQTWRDTAETVLELMAPADDLGAIAMLEAVLGWASAEPDYFMDGATTGRNYQRGRIIATRVLPDRTAGASTYTSADEALDKAVQMERAYREWLRLRGPLGA